MNDGVKSPCISVCALDEDDICMGCYRSVEEIAGWSQYGDEEKREVIARAGERCRARYGVPG